MSDPTPLRLLQHLERLERDCIEEQVQAVEADLAAGWVPETVPVEVLVSRLRERHD